MSDSLARVMAQGCFFRTTMRAPHSWLRTIESSGSTWTGRLSGYLNKSKAL